jgi:hypothetical protein
MKRLSFIFIIIIFFCFQKNQQAQNSVLIKNIEYDVPIINYDLCEGSTLAETEWWKRNIETSKRWYFQQAIINKAIDGQIKVYDDNGTELSHQALLKLVSFSDTIMIARAEPPYDFYDTVITKFISPAEIHTIRFRETWYYDPNTFQITKEISEYAPMIAFEKEVKVKNQTRYISVDKPLFWIKSDINTDKKHFSELTDFILYNCPVYKNMDVVMPQFGNLVKTSADTLIRSNFIDSLISVVSRNKIKTYFTTDFSDYYDFSIDSMIPLSSAEINDILFLNDTFTMQRTTTPFDQYDTITHMRLPTKYLSMFRFYEKWLFDPKTMELQKEVMAFSPCEVVYNDKGEFKGIKPLFNVMFGKPIRCFIE